MMKVLQALWRDEAGAILSAELVLLGTLGVVGATVGVKMAATAVNDEMKDLAGAFRSLDQSYCYEGFCTPHARTAGSCYQQEDVAVSLEKLRQLDPDAATDGKRPKKRKHRGQSAPDRG